MFRSLFATALLLLTITPTAHASNGHPDHVSAFSTINIPADETAGDIACVFCTLNIQGDVAGDIAVLFGTINAEPSRTISGDVAAFFSTLRLDEDVRIHGDLAAFASTTDIAPSATIEGSRAVFPRGLALVALSAAVLAPLLILVGTVWLVVRLFRRDRYA